MYYMKSEESKTKYFKGTAMIWQQESSKIFDAFIFQLKLVLVKYNQQY